MTSMYAYWGNGKVKLTWVPDDKLPAQALITSVHGLCFKENKLLLVNLNDRNWDIPGGHMEQGEAPVDCFKREAYEEGYIEGSCALLGYITVDHTENFEWDSEGLYPKIGYQVFYYMDIQQIVEFKAAYESTDRIWIHPAEVKNYKTDWNLLYQRILDRAVRMRK
ncbi:NUDIX hydrolase [Oceanobacillus jeddahense]|uniref:NUDIX hydrolase n=1 Tax=Oceanobacillus jeddahense TaxID=1462527 RepID=UPI000595B844|nr:NUDIX domain-containing protein [Oceanobacillus jeddahense]